jgi:hypothetical protein
LWVFLFDALAAMPRFKYRIPMNLIRIVVLDIQAKIEPATNNNRASRDVYVNLLKKHFKLTVQRSMISPAHFRRAMA